MSGDPNLALLDSLLDPYGVDEIFAEELAYVGRHPTFARIVFTIGVPGSPCKQVVCRLVIPADQLARMARQLSGNGNIMPDDQRIQARRLVS